MTDMRQKIRKPAKALKPALEVRLRDILPESAMRWREDNKQAFEELGKDIEKDGMWSDGLRVW
jgi:post-segregation antitoxin (ccd killing protein)